MSVTIGFLILSRLLYRETACLAATLYGNKIAISSNFWRLRDQTIVYDGHCDFLVKVQGATEFA